jgi:signal transduction histidine kinase
VSVGDKLHASTGDRSSRRRPRYTIRLRLSLLYGGVFLISGTVLLAIAYGGSSSSSGSVAVAPQAQAPQVGAEAVNVHVHDRHQLLIWSGIALAIMAVASMGLGWLLAGRALRPLQAITSAARAISADNLHERLALGGPDDELRELGDTFDELLGRLESSFEAQRQFVANASHELRTPLTLERAILEVTLADPAASAGTLRAACERVLAIGEQQERMIEALLTLARSERGVKRREELQLDAITREVLGDRGEEIARRGLRLDAKLESAPATGDPRLIERLVANLIDNAIGHNTAHGWVAVTTAVEDGHAVLTVSNGGPVIAPEDVEQLLDPFQRLGPDRIGHGEGLGLGLSIVSAIASVHGASLAANAQPAGGLQAEVRFPKTSPFSDSQAAPSSSTSPIPK